MSVYQQGNYKIFSSKSKIELHEVIVTMVLPELKAVDKLEVTIGAKKIGDVLQDLGYITQSQLNRALEYQEQNGGELGWILANLGYITRLELFEGLARHYGLSFETNIAYSSVT
jgi:hypothetical protein